MKASEATKASLLWTMRKTYKLSRLVVPVRSGNSVISVAPLRDLDMHKGGREKLN